MDVYRKYLDPKILDKVSGLELKARLVVEGFLQGQQKSPKKGQSVEFLEHREYVPGDDPRRLDWKVYAKSDRFYVKQYEEETNLKAYIILDTSKSMAYSSGGVSKFDYAKYLAASLVYLVQQQRDAVALVLWDKELKKFLPPGTSPLHMKNVYSELSAAEPNGQTDIVRLLGELAERVRKRSLFVVLSDLFDANREGMRKGLNHVRTKGHDVIVFHVLDPAEKEFPFDRMTMFEGLEIDEKLLADPKALKEAYLEEMQGFCREIKSACMSNQMDYVGIDTGQNLGIALSAYLATRMGSGSR